MAVLPTKENLGQRPLPNAPTVQPQMVSMDLTQGAKADAVLAKGLSDLGTGFLQVQQAKERSSFIQAKSQFLQKSITIQSELEKDPDYTTYGERYQSAMAEAKKEAKASLNSSSFFGGNQFSDNLESELNLHEAQGLSRLADIADKKEGDQKRADLTTLIDQNSNALFQTGDEKQRAVILQSTNDAIEALKEEGHIDAVVAVDQKRKFAENYAMNSFSLLSPSQQIAVLSPQKKGNQVFFAPTGGIGDMIPASKKPALLERARDQQRIDAEKAVLNQERQQKQLEVQSKNNIISHIEQGGELSNIKNDDWLKLKDSDKELVRKLYLRKQGLGSSNPIEEDKAYFAFEDLYTNNPAQLAEVDPLEIEVKVAPDKVAEVKSWRSKAIAGENPDLAIKKQNEIANLGLREMGISPQSNKADPFKKRFLEETKAFEETNGKKPNVKELRDIKDSLIVDVTTEGFFSDNKKKLYQVDPSDYEDIKVPEKDANEIINLYKQKKGITPTKDQIKSKYIERMTPDSKKKDKSFDLSYAIPENPQNIEDIQKSLDDEKMKRPWAWDGVDTEERSKEIAKRYYKNLV